MLWKNFRKVKSAVDNLDRRIRSGATPEDAWNETSIELASAAESHCRAFIVLRFAESVKALHTKISKELHQVLSQLCELYAAYWVIQKLGDFLQVGYILYILMKQNKNAVILILVFLSE